MSVGNLALSDRSSGEDSRTGQARGFDRFRVGWKIWAIWFFAFFIISAIVPRDAHFDAAHYHLHNGWSFWAGRLDQDFAPSEMHSFLNPFHSAIVWLLVSTLPGPLAIGLLGLVQAVILPGLYALLARLAWRLDIDVSPAILFAIALACFTSQPMIIMLSSVLNDHWGAATFLFALVLLVPHDREMPGWKALVAGSILVGAGFGMKLTNAVYVVGYAAAVLVIMPGWQARLRACAICAAAGLGAVLLTGGWWAWMMYERFGNPIFPNLNALFDAPLGPDTAFRDEKFLPGSFLEGALRPFWFSFDASPINEQPTRDFRLLAGYLAALAIPVVAGIRWRSGEAGRQDRALLALSLGFLVTFTAWTAIFSIQRYAMGLYLIGPAFRPGLAGSLRRVAVPPGCSNLGWTSRDFRPCRCASAVDELRAPASGSVAELERALCLDRASRLYRSRWRDHCHVLLLSERIYRTGFRFRRHDHACRCPPLEQTCAGPLPRAGARRNPILRPACVWGHVPRSGVAPTCPCKNGRRIRPYC